MCVCVCVCYTGRQFSAAEVERFENEQGSDLLLRGNNKRGGGKWSELLLLLSGYHWPARYFIIVLQPSKAPVDYFQGVNCQLFLAVGFPYLDQDDRRKRQWRFRSAAYWPSHVHRLNWKWLTNGFDRVLNIKLVLVALDVVRGSSGRLRKWSRLFTIRFLSRERTRKKNGSTIENRRVWECGKRQKARKICQVVASRCEAALCLWFVSSVCVWVCVKDGSVRLGHKNSRHVR